MRTVPTADPEPRAAGALIGLGCALLFVGAARVLCLFPGATDEHHAALGIPMGVTTSVAVGSVLRFGLRGKLGLALGAIAVLVLLPAPRMAVVELVARALVAAVVSALFLHRSPAWRTSIGPRPSGFSTLFSSHLEIGRFCVLAVATSCLGAAAAVGLSWLGGGPAPIVDPHAAADRAPLLTATMAVISADSWAILVLTPLCLVLPDWSMLVGPGASLSPSSSASAASAPAAPLARAGAAGARDPRDPPTEAGLLALVAALAVGAFLLPLPSLVGDRAAGERLNVVIGIALTVATLFASVRGGPRTATAALAVVGGCATVGGALHLGPYRMWLTSSAAFVSLESLWVGSYGAMAAAAALLAAPRMVLTEPGSPQATAPGEPDDADETLDIHAFAANRAPDAMFMVSASGEIAWANASARAVLPTRRSYLPAAPLTPDSSTLAPAPSVAPTELTLGRRPLDSELDPRDAPNLSIFDVDTSLEPATFERLWQRLATVGPTVRETQHQTANGTAMPVEVALAYLDRAQRGREPLALFHVRDLTARFSEEERRRTLEAQLRHAQKMEAIGTLAGGIAHDFNNVLAAVLGNVEFSLQVDNVPDEVREALEDIQTAGGRARELVARLSTMSRREEPRLELVNVSAVLQEVERLLRATLPATIEIVVKLPRGPVPLPADGAQLHQALLNLGTNAAHAMREQNGGRLTMEVAAVSLSPREARARHLSLRPDDYIRVRVTDTGQGMSEATKERIFEPFFTTKPAGEGTGLGLAVVHGIVEGHHGAIVVESTEGAGTTFELYFPATSAKFTPPPPAPNEPARVFAWRVLFVDDDALVLAAGRRTLVRSGCRVTAVGAPEEALALVHARPDDYDILITDLTMPGMHGTELARAVTAVRPDLPIIAITGYHGRPDEPVERSGIREVLAKPFTDTALLTVIARHATPTAGPRPT
jgi:signal transduction histidine kinase/ActR/RegA family two-component response regulator